MKIVHQAQRQQSGVEASQMLHGALKVAVKGARLSAEVRERGGLAVANEIALDGISCFGVSLKKSVEREREREREKYF